MVIFISELKIYLAGACKCLEDEGAEWRSEIEKMLAKTAEWQDKKVKVFNPLNYFSYKETRHKTQKQVKEFYMNKIKKCDIVIVNLNYSDQSVGTGQECQCARMLGIPIIGFGTKDVYPWIKEVDCEVSFDSMHEAVDYVRDYYLT